MGFAKNKKCGNVKKSKPLIEKEITVGLKYSWWKPEEIESIRTQLQAGIAIENVVIPDRKTEYIKRRARKKGLVPKQRHPALTEDQKRELSGWKNKGFSTREISDFDLLGLPHRTANAIQKILGKIGEVSENRSLAAKNKKRWCNGEKQTFDDFLRQSSLKLAPAQIAKMFDVVIETVTARQRFLGVKTSLAETLAIPYVKKKIEKSSRERSKKMLLNFEKYIAKKKEDLEALAERLRGQKRLVPWQEKRCGKCKKNWFKHKRFFVHATHKTRLGTSWYFLRDCVICAAKQRHQKKVAEYQQKYSQPLE